MIDSMKVKRSIYFATLQGYVIFETELYIYNALSFGKMVGLCNVRKDRSLNHKKILKIGH